MTDKSAPKTPAKDEAKDQRTQDAGTAGGERDDVAPGQKVMERGDIGAADGPGKPETVKVITEVRPGAAN